MPEKDGREGGGGKCKGDFSLSFIILEVKLKEDGEGEGISCEFLFKDKGEREEFSFEMPEEEGTLFVGDSLLEDCFSLFIGDDLRDDFSFKIVAVIFPIEDGEESEDGEGEDFLGVVDFDDIFTIFRVEGVT